MADKGAGNYAFIDNPDAALSAFGKELGGLLSTYAQDLIIELTPHEGHQLLEVVSDFNVEEIITGEARIRIPNILSEETLHVVVKTKLAVQKHPGPRQVNAVTGKLSFQVLGADGNMKLESVEANAKVQFVKAGEEQTKPTKEVDEFVARAQLVQAQNLAEVAAQQGNYGGAAAAFSSLDFEARGLENYSNMSTRLKSNYTSRQAYAASGGNRIGMSKGLRRAQAVSNLAREDQAMLYSAGIDSLNSVQEQVLRSFEEEPHVGDAEVQAPVVVNQTPDPAQFVPQGGLGTTRSLAKQRTGRW